MTMDFSPLKELLDSLTISRLPCADVRVMRKGKKLFQYTVGYGDVENELPLQGDARFCAYSLTKVLTSACAMSALEEGLLTLETELRALMPEFSGMQVLEADASGRQLRPARGEITVGQLLTMSAGFGADMHLLASGATQEAVRTLAGQPLLFEPGTRWLYGLCYEVLGAALERAYGIRLRDIFRTRIYEKAGMHSSCFLSEMRDLSGITPLCRVREDSYEPMAFDMTYAPNAEYDSGGAGLVTSAEDYLLFLDALINGRIVSKESFSKMCVRQLNGVQQRDFNWPQMKGYSYGLGLRVPLEGSGLTDFGWGGAAGAYALMEPGSGISLCFFTSVLGTDEVFLYSAIRDALKHCAF